mgnify:CR=1 FL=1
MTSDLKFDMYGDKVLLRPEECETITESGIVMPGDAVPEGVKYAEVVLVGRGLRDAKGELIAMFSKVGQRVMHNIAHPLEVELAGEVFYMIAEPSILGVMKN